MQTKADLATEKTIFAGFCRSLAAMPYATAHQRPAARSRILASNA
jgi:hypothetical protein